MFKWLKEFRSLWYEDLVRRKKATPFIIFVFFLTTFIITRLVATHFPNFHIILPYHFHHFFVGIILLIVSNWIAIIGRGKELKRICAAIFGVSLGLIFDELGMILICGTAGTMCDPDKLYWARINYDIVMYVAIAFLLIIYFKPFWLAFRTKILGMIYRPWRMYHRVGKRIKKEFWVREVSFKKELKKTLALLKPWR